MKTWVNVGESDIRSYAAIAKVFSNHEYLLNNFFEKDRARMRLAPDEMIEQALGFSHGEIVLIKVALDIWSGSGDARVWELLESLDKQNFVNVVGGLMLVKHEKSTLIGSLDGGYL